MKVDLTRKEILSILELLKGLDNIDLDYIKTKRNLNFDMCGIDSAICKLEDIDTSYCKDIELEHALKYVVRIPLKSDVDKKYSDMINIILRTSLMQEWEVSTRKDVWTETQDEKYYKIELLLTDNEFRELNKNEFDIISEE